jgi:hypothetical protein
VETIGRVSHPFTMPCPRQCENKRKFIIKNIKRAFQDGARRPKGLDYKSSCCLGTQVDIHLGYRQLQQIITISPETQDAYQKIIEPLFCEYFLLDLNSGLCAW